MSLLETSFLFSSFSSFFNVLVSFCLVPRVGFRFVWFSVYISLLVLRFHGFLFFLCDDGNGEEIPCNEFGLAKS